MVDLALRHKIERARTHWLSLVGVEGVAWTAAALGIAALLCFHVDWNWALTAHQRIGCWAIGGTLLAACLALLVALPCLRPRPDEAVAARVERRFPNLRERLLSTVEFGRLTDPAARGFSAPMVAALSQETNAVTAGLDFRRAFGLEGVRRASTGLAAVAAVFILHLFFLPNAMGAWFDRMAHPFGSTPVWRDTQLRIEPLRGKALKGGTLLVSVRQEGKHVSSGTLRFQFGQGRWQQARMSADRGGALTHRFLDLTEPVHYYATAGDGLSDTGSVEVVDPPAILGAEITYRFPAYMDLPPEHLRSASPGIAAPLGSAVDLVLKASKPLRSAQMVLAGKPAAAWPVAGDTIRGSLPVKQDGSYSLRLIDTDGFANPQSITFPIKSIPDQTPEVRIDDPTADLTVATDANVPLKLFAKDDHGVQLLRIAYAVSDHKAPPLPAGRGGKRDKIVEGTVTWHMSSLKVKPGDVIRYRAEALDYDNISGPHVGRSTELQIRIADRGELEQALAQKQKELLEALKQLIKSQKENRAAVEAQRSAPKPDAARIGDAEQQQRGLAAQAGDIARQIGELTRSAQMNNLANPDETHLQQAAQQAMTDIANNAMPRAANQIATAQPNAKANPQQSKQDLGSASNQQADILRRLADVQQNLQPANDLDRLAKRASRLAAAQQSLQSRANQILPQTLGKSMQELTPSQRDSLSRLASEQQSLQRATDQLAQDVGRAAEASRRDPAQQEAVRSASQAMQEAGIPQKQGQAAQNIQQNALGQASGQQGQAAKDLQALAEALRNAANANDPHRLQRQIAAAIAHLKQMMQAHQRTMEQTKQNPNAQQRAELARQQRALQAQAEAMRRQLQQLSRQAPSAGRASQSMSQAGQNLGQSSQSLSQGQSQSAQSQQQQAMEAMRNAMMSLEQAMAEAKQDDDPFAELRKKLTAMADAERGVLAATHRINGEVKDSGAQEPQRREMGQLAQKQTGLSEEGKGVLDELPGNVFRRFMEEARGHMGRSATALHANNPADSPTQRAERRAITILDQLAKALDPDPDDNSEGSGGGGGGGGGQVDKALLRALAELRLLRLMEKGIKGQTQDLDDGRQANQPLSPEQEQQVDELSGNQGSAREMAGRTAELLRKYRQLVEKVTSAGEHMGNAKQGLERKVTGDPTQEEEQQAIIKLTEALKMTQRQARSQSQSQSRRSAQGNPSQMRGSQGGSTPGLSGRAGARTTATEGLTGGSDRDRGFGGLSGRDLDALRQGSREKSPAEYRDLIDRYFKALSERGTGGR